MRYLLILFVSLTTILSSEEEKIPTRCGSVFHEIYKQKLWGDSRTGGEFGSSGDGSILDSNKELSLFLISFFKEHSVKSFLDLGCGDCEWQPNIPWYQLGIQYTGLDVVPTIIEENKQRLWDVNNMNFYSADLFTSTLPSSDVYFIKDVLAHMPDRFIQHFLNKVKRSCKYLLIVTDVTDKQPTNTTLGSWRALHPDMFTKDGGVLLKEFVMPFYGTGEEPPFDHTKHLYLLKGNRDS